MERYRSLVVHLDNRPECAERVRLACECARRFDAALTGMYLAPATGLSPSLAELMPAELASTRLDLMAELQNRAERSFREALAANGVVGEAVAPAGSEFSAAVAYARGADVAIFGQPAPDDADERFSRRLLDSVVLSSGRPALVVPYIGRFNRLGERIVVAWSNERESARAVADALPFLLQAKSVDVVRVNLESEDAVLDAQVTEQLRTYFRRHAIEARIHDDRVKEIDVGEWLLNRISDLGADLIVMGGHGQARISELVLGSVTRTLLDAMTVPVLMSH